MNVPDRSSSSYSCKVSSCLNPLFKVELGSFSSGLVPDTDGVRYLS